MKQRMTILALAMAVIFGLVVSAHAAGLITVFASAARTASTNSSTMDFNPNAPFTGMKCLLDVSAASGTLDVSIQEQDPLSTNFATPSLASFSQKTATGADSLLIAPGVTESANSKVDDVIVNDWRARAVIGGASPTFTFTLGCVPLGPIQSF